MLYGVDVSTYQAPDMIPGDVDFVVARATYGTSLDAKAHRHADRTRQLGAVFGLYHFFVPGKPVAAQAEAFGAAAGRCGLTVGDMIPWVDVEAVPASGGKWVQPCPEWEPALRATVEALRRDWGACGLYVTSRDWRLLGKPQWLLSCPLWVAHWIGEQDPITPSGAGWSIHQYRVGPYQRHGGGGSQSEIHSPMAIDHDRATGPLPLITAAHTRAGSLSGVPMIDLTTAALEASRGDRDRLVAGFEEAEEDLAVEGLRVAERFWAAVEVAHG